MVHVRNEWRALLAAALLAGGTASAEPGATRPAPAKIHARLAEKLGEGSGPVSAWVAFTDKPGARPAPATERAAARRAKAGYVPSVEDAPLHAPYVDAVRAAGGALRSRSRWLNAVAVEADRASIERIARLPFVAEIRPVAAFAKRPEPARSLDKRTRELDLDYGLSDVQLGQIRATPLLEAGYSGAGVHILMLDSGFYTGAPCFASTEIERRRDFVDGDDVVEGIAYESHGTQTLSVIGGYDPGWIASPAQGATYYLARTEDTTQEIPAEEDNWIEALEWGESLGVDIVSSSLGYNLWYEYEDLTGESAAISIAAEAAVERGVVVVNSAGNEAQLPWHYVIPPADAPSVLAIAAVNINGDRVSFSSVGPTADGRTKPDLAALGSGVAGIDEPRAVDPNQLYGEVLNGTSYSAPLVAGVSALLLEIHPTITPDLLAAALKATASRAGAPDNQLGWGIVDAYRAALLPVVRHDPAADAAWNGSNAFEIEVEASLYPGFDPPAIVSGGAAAFTDTAFLEAEGAGSYSVELPAASASDARRYYFLFERGDTAYTVPAGAPETYYETGDATPPSIAHVPIGDYPLQAWPAEVVAVVKDAGSVDDDSVRVDYSVLVPEGKAPLAPGSFPLSRRDDSTFAGTFPAFALEAGASVEYRIRACDVSGNCVHAPLAGSYQANLYSVGYALRYGAEGDEGPTNPFVSGTGDGYRILFDLPARETVRIRIYDAAGRLVREALDRAAGPGARLEAVWDGKDSSGRRVDSGVYFLRFEAGSFTATRKVVVIR